MTDPRDRESRPGDKAAILEGEALSDIISPIRRSRVAHHARPDLWHAYPPPEVNLRPTMFGLPLDLYRAEANRCRESGWRNWEIATRFPKPDVTQ